MQRDGKWKIDGIIEPVWEAERAATSPIGSIGSIANLPRNLPNPDGGQQKSRPVDDF